MRRKPVSRDEVRIFSDHRWYPSTPSITTAPIDAVRATEYSWGHPILRLWDPLLRELGEPTLGTFVMAPEPCRQCGRKFWRDHRSPGLYCSDHCAALARRAKYATAQGAARATARSGRRCERCGEPIKAARSTMRYCSVRCRVAAHRAGA
jgi:hypothetical protein